MRRLLDADRLGRFSGLDSLRCLDRNGWLLGWRLRRLCRHGLLDCLVGNGNHLVGVGCLVALRRHDLLVRHKALNLRRLDGLGGLWTVPVGVGQNGSVNQVDRGASAEGQGLDVRLGSLLP